MHHILIGTDSRGKYLQEYVEQYDPFPATWSTHVEIYPGKTISEICYNLINKIKVLPVEENSNIVVMIAGGICNLTTKTNIPSGGYILNYDFKPRSEKVENLQTELKKTVIEFQDYNVILKFATIPPVSLFKKNERFSAFLSSFSQAQINDEQKILEEDVMNVNSFISSINEMNSTRTVRWDKDIIKIHMKRRGTHKTLKKNSKFIYKDLYDGVHPYMELAYKWYFALCKSILNDIKDMPSQHLDVEEEEDDEEDMESWDFKRVVKF